MSGEDQRSPHEIVIIKRRGGGHGDGHHGGAWKIAFADFMTALMCFFLVMWLINATDKKTVTQVATYFNPLRLNDRTPSTKGLHEPAPQTQKDAPGEKKKEPDKKSKPSKDKIAPKPEPAAATGDNEGTSSAGQATGKTTDAELLRDPYGVLERIAASEPGNSAARRSTEGAGSMAGLPLDTFDPARAGGSSKSSETKGQHDAHRGAARAEIAPADRADAAAAARSGTKVDTESGAPVEGPRTIGSAKELERRIAEAIAVLHSAGVPGIEIRDSKTEILISVTDKYDFGMFAVASAQPTAPLVRVMDRVAKVLGDTIGNVTIRGHTDGRRFRSAENDNWRLSMARAQMAYYMLVRGGVPESRIKRLEGHADRNLKDAVDPLAAQNRRIEILIAKGET